MGIPPHLLPHLATYVASLPVTGRDGYLFPGHDGISPMSEKALCYAYAQARKYSGTVSHAGARRGDSAERDHDEPA